MANNILIKDANDVNRTLHTIEDSTSAHYNMSIPITTSGVPIFTTAAPGIVCVAGTIEANIADNAPVSVRGGILGAVSLGGGTAHIGRVSVFNDSTPQTVSVVNQITANVSLGGSSAIIGKVSTAGLVSVWPANTIVPDADGKSLQGFQAEHVLAANYVRNRVGGNWDMMTGTSLGLLVTGSVGISGPLPTGTNLLGGVSVRGTPDVGAIQSGTWNVNASVVGLVSINGTTKVHVSNVLPDHGVTQSGTWTVQPGNTANTTPWLVSVGGNVSLSDNAPVSVRGGLIGLNSGSNLIGAVSVRGNILGSVSISNIADVSVQDNAPVSVRGGILGAVSIGSGIAQIGRVSVFVDQVPFNVSVNNSLPIPVSVVAGRVSIQGTVSISPQTILVHVCNTAPGGASGSTQVVSIAGPVSTQAVQVAFTDGTNARTPLTNTTGNILVHVCNAQPTPTGITQLVSIGGAVSNQAIQIAGRDPSGDARTPNVDVLGNIMIHGVLSVGDTVTATDPIFPMGAVDNSNIWRNLEVHGSDFALKVWVCNANEVSIGGPVSTQAVQVAFTDGTNARTPRVDVSGVIQTTGFTFTNQYIFTRPADTTAYSGPTTAFPGNAGDLIANSTTNTAVVPLKFKVARIPGGMTYIRRARMFKTGTAAAANIHNVATPIRLHLFNSTNEVSNATGDNVSMKASPVSVYLGYIDLLQPVSTIGIRIGAGTSVAYYQGVPAGASEIIVNLSSNQVSIQGLLEARGAWTPITSEIFTIQLDVFQS